MQSVNKHELAQALIEVKEALFVGNPTKLDDFILKLQTEQLREPVYAVDFYNANYFICKVPTPYIEMESALKHAITNYPKGLGKPTTAKVGIFSINLNPGDV